jgi:hypothetical protein
VGGCFTRAGEADARHVARWSGSAWVPMGEGVPNAVHCLQVYGGQLYAGAYRWDDGAWVNELQTDGPVHALALYRGRLVAGGDFARIGERAALNIAGWPEPITAARLAAFTAERLDGGARLAWELVLAGPEDGAPGCHVWRETGGAAPVRLTGERLRGEIVGAGARYVFTDPQAPLDAAVYRLQQVTDDGRTVWLGEAQLPAAAAVPGALRLAAYPNPFNPRTTLLVDLPAAGPARLTVHDARGALVAVLRDGPLPAGEQRVAWDGRDRRGRPVPSGVYFARLRADTGQRIFKLILAR